MHGPRIEEILKMQNTCFAEYEKFGVPKFEMINNVLIKTNAPTTPWKPNELKKKIRTGKAYRGGK